MSRPEKKPYSKPVFEEILPGSKEFGRITALLETEISGKDQNEPNKNKRSIRK